MNPKRSVSRGSKEPRFSHTSIKYLPLPAMPNFSLKLPSRKTLPLCAQNVSLPDPACSELLKTLFPRPSLLAKRCVCAVKCFGPLFSLLL